MPLNPSVKICTHVKVTGIKCGSPALRGERFCYFHERMIHGVRTPPKARIHPMALIENEEGIQAALMETINAIVRNTIDLPRANLILRALSIAVRNSRRVHFDCREDEMVRAIPDYQSAPPQAVSANVKKENEETRSVVGKQASHTAEEIGRVAKRRNSLAPHVSAAKASIDEMSPRGTVPSAQLTAQNQVPRKPPGRVTSAVIAHVAVNASPLRE